MKYDELEDAIIERLQPLKPGVEIEYLPDTPAKYSEVFEKPRVTVAYNNSQFSPEIVRGRPALWSTAEYAGEEFAEVHIFIRSRTARGATGVHAVKQAVTDLLYGYQPGDWGRLFPKEYKLLEHETEKGVWLYVAIFVCTAPVVQKYTDDHETAYPDLVGSTFNVNLAE